jgi:hypothetical protein
MTPSTTSEDTMTNTINQLLSEKPGEFADTPLGAAALARADGKTDLARMHGIAVIEADRSCARRRLGWVATQPYSLIAR